MNGRRGGCVLSTLRGDAWRGTRTIINTSTEDTVARPAYHKCFGGDGCEYERGLVLPCLRVWPRLLRHCPARSGWAGTADVRGKLPATASNRRRHHHHHRNVRCGQFPPPVFAYHGKRHPWQDAVLSVTCPSGAQIQVRVPREAMGGQKLSCVDPGLAVAAPASPERLPRSHYVPIEEQSGKTPTTPWHQTGTLPLQRPPPAARHLLPATHDRPSTTRS